MILIPIVQYLFLAYILMILVRILSSWVPEFRDAQFVRFCAHYTDPYLNLFRKIIPPIGMIDISPIIAFIALRFIEWGVIQFLLVLLGP